MSETTPYGALTRPPTADIAARVPPRTTVAALARRHAALCAVVLVALTLGAWRLDRYPQTWFDEGIYLQVSRNVVERHEYFARSADGVRDYTPVVGVGPTLLLPIALALKLGGASLGAARVVPLLYLAAASALLFLAARRLFGARDAFLSLALVATLPSLDWFATGRQALGEVPAFAFLLLGGLLAFRARTQAAVAVAGTILGLAMVTKGQYLLILPPAIVVVAVVDHLDGRARPLRWHATLLVGALAAYAAWIAALLLVMGPAHIVENVRLLRQASAGALIVFDVRRMAAAFKLLLGPSSFMLVAPAMLAGIVAMRNARGDRRLALTAIWTFAALWLGWFALASIAWPRYAFPGIALSALFMGWLVGHVLDALPRRIGERFAAHARARALSRVAGGALLCLAFAILGWRELAPIARAGGEQPQRFAAVLDASVPPGAIVDAWEPELGFLSDASLQYPAPGSLDEAVRERWLGQGSTPDFSDQVNGDYLVIGPFARWVGVYATAATSPRYVLVQRVGDYELYRRTGR